MRPMEQVEVLRAACCVAGADGSVTDKERQLIEKLADVSGVGAASLEAMVDRAKADCSFCDEQFQILKTDPQETMAILFEIAMSDGQVGTDEEQSLWSFAERLGVPRNIFDALVEKTRAIKKGQN